MNLPIPCIIKHHFDDGVYNCAVLKDGRDYVHVVRMDSAGIGVIRIEKERRIRLKGEPDRFVEEKFEPLEGRNLSADLQRFLSAGEKFGITLTAQRLLREGIARAEGNEVKPSTTEEGTTMARKKKQESIATVPADLDKYKVSEKVRTASGRRAIDTDDTVAKQLRGKELDEVYALAAEALGTTQKELKEKYGKLNPGMQRMNLGNRIRGAKAKKAK